MTRQIYYLQQAVHINHWIIECGIVLVLEFLPIHELRNEGVLGGIQVSCAQEAAHLCHVGRELEVMRNPPERWVTRIRQCLIEPVDEVTSVGKLWTADKSQRDRDPITIGGQHTLRRVD